tara:strand:+ start:331 stop:540 length:210 start_codon:yes stop_codon:yes gene_type:complete
MATENEIKSEAQNSLLRTLQSDAASYSIGGRSKSAHDLDKLLKIAREMAFDADRQQHGMLRVARIRRAK